MQEHRTSRPVSRHWKNSRSSERHLSRVYQAHPRGASSSNDASAAWSGRAGAARSVLSGLIARRSFAPRTLGRPRISETSQGKANSNRSACRCNCRHVRRHYTFASIQSGKEHRTREGGHRGRAWNTVRPGANGSFSQSARDRQGRSEVSRRNEAETKKCPTKHEENGRPDSGSQISMADSTRRAASAGSLDPKIPAIEATPAAPAAIGT